MGTTLTGTTPQDTYDSLIKVTDNGPISGTAKYLSDGLGNDSVLALSTTAVGIGTNTPVGKLTIAGTSAQPPSSGTTPNSLLQIKGSLGNQLNIGSNTATGDYGSYIQASDTNLAVPYPLNLQPVGGNVGIGTSAPAAKLHVAGENIILDRTGGDPFISFYTGGTTNNVALYGGASTGLRAFVGGSERVRVTANGLTFNGDTAAANALDDYEEGTWTPVLRGAATAGTYETDSVFANYTKIGRQVSINMIFNLAAAVTGGGTGYAIITGLPFTKSANQQIAATAKFGTVDFNASTKYVIAEFNSVAATSIFYFAEVLDNAAPIDLPISAFGNNSQIQVSLTYFV